MVFEFPQVLLLWTALFFLIFALPMMFAPHKILRVLERMMKNEDFIRLRGIIALLFGLAYVTVYQVIDGTWGLLFSLFGYLSLLKGIRLIWNPAYANTKFKRMYNTEGKMILRGAIILICAALLAWIALTKI
ncbi:MAG: hypothetical protein CO170_04615 [candidate division SR1 bacterium CG_4_9_14_3_um_filter_40_9]|nr:MAG: hypothetical protein CO170_04615 [candidate division SR1 bacterium CG_4_9_14_3_um_filter_40_9]